MAQTSGKGRLRLVIVGAVGACLVVVAGGILDSIRAQVGSEPWQFESPQERQAAQDIAKGTDYPFDNYKTARDLLDRDKKDQLDEAIARLKLVIGKERESNALATDHVQRAVNYYPYFYLAKAYSAKGQFADAERCLEKEKSFGQMRGKDAGRFEELSEWIADRRDMEPLKSLAAKIANWNDPDSPVRLSQDGRSKVESIVTEAGEIGEAQDLKAAKNSLIDALWGLCDGELRRLREETTELDNDWRDAFAGNRDLVDTSACSMPASRTADTIEQAAGTIEKCSDNVVEAMRLAFSWSCRQTEEARARLSALGGSRPASTVCAGNPNSLNYTQLASRLDATGQDLDAIGVDIANRQQERDEELGELMTAAERALGHLPTIPGDCRNELGLGQAEQTIETTRRGLNPDRIHLADSTRDFDGEVQNARRELKRAVVAGAGPILEWRGRLLGLDDTKLDALQMELDSYRGAEDPGDAAFHAVCQAAVAANRAVMAVVEENETELRRRAQDTLWLLQAARDSHVGLENVAEISLRNLGCLSTIRLSPSPSAANRKAWFREVPRQATAVQECIESFRQGVQAALQRLMTDAEEVRASLESGAAAMGGSQDNPLGESVESAARRVTDLDRKLKRLAALYSGDGMDADSDGLLATIRELKLEERIPSDWWGGSGVKEEKRLLAIRDRAVSVVVPEAEERLPGDRQFADSIVPFAVLMGALEEFAEGRLDQAIVIIREARVQGNLPATGKASAVGHAALSYFLYVKSMAFSDAESAARGRILEDAAREARLAASATDAFSLPAFVTSASFRKFFDDQVGFPRGQS